MVLINTIKNDIIDYLKRNKSVVIVPLVSIIGYVVLIVSLVLKDPQGVSSSYLPVLPMLSGIALNLIPVMFFYDVLKTYAQSKEETPNYIMNEPPKNNKKKKHQKNDEDIQKTGQSFTLKTNSFFLPPLSIIYRIFCYTGIFLLASILIFRYLGFRFTPAELGRFFVTGIFFSLLYESFRIISYIIVSVFNLFLPRKVFLIILKILAFALFLFLLITFIIGFIGTKDIAGGFLSGLSAIATHPVWDYFPLSALTFDLIYTAVGYDMGNVFLYTGILFIVMEVLLYVLLVLKKFLQPFGIYL
jgi:hypothetical protein